MLAVAYSSGGLRGARSKVRRIPGIDAMDEAIGRAVEMGRPLSPATASPTSGTQQPAHRPSPVSASSATCQKCAEVSTRLIVPVRQPRFGPSQLMSSRPHIRWRVKERSTSRVTSCSSARTVRVLKQLHRPSYEGEPGANIMIGAYWAESMQLAETGSRVGAMQISGTARLARYPSSSFQLTTASSARRSTPLEHT